MCGDVCGIFDSSFIDRSSTTEEAEPGVCHQSVHSLGLTATLYVYYYSRTWRFCHFPCSEKSLRDLSRMFCRFPTCQAPSCHCIIAILAGAAIAAPLSQREPSLFHWAYFPAKRGPSAGADPGFWDREGGRRSLGGPGAWSPRKCLFVELIFHLLVASRVFVAAWKRGVCPK